MYFLEGEFSAAHFYRIHLRPVIDQKQPRALFTLKVLNQCQQFRENFIGVLDRLPGITLRASKVGLPMCVEALSHVQVE